MRSIASRLNVGEVGTGASGGREVSLPAPRRSSSRLRVWWLCSIQHCGHDVAALESECYA